MNDNMTRFPITIQEDKQQQTVKTGAARSAIGKPNRSDRLN